MNVCVSLSVLNTLTVRKQGVDDGRDIMCMSSHCCTAGNGIRTVVRAEPPQRDGGC